MSDETEIARLKRDNRRLRARLAQAGNSPEIRRLRIESDRIEMIRHCAKEVIEYEYPQGLQTIPTQEGRRRWRNLMEQVRYVPPQ